MCDVVAGMSFVVVHVNRLKDGEFEYALMWDTVPGAN